MSRTLSILASGLLLAALLQASHATAQQRLISTDAAVTDMLFAFGADDRLVAVDVTSRLPEGYRDLPRVGYHRALSPEGLLALQPDLLIGSEHLGPPPVLAALDGAGVPVLRLPAATEIDQLLDNLRRVADAVGAGDSGRQQAERLQRLAASLETSPLRGRSAILLLSVEGGKLRMAGADTAGGAFIDLLGADNLGDFGGYRTYSAESLLSLDPDLILVAGSEADAAEQLMTRNPLLRHARAHREGRLLRVDAANLVAGLSLAAVEEAERLVRSLGSEVAAR
jgi:iron complex transport system substrate-binding protein